MKISKFQPSVAYKSVVIVLLPVDSVMFTKQSKGQEEPSCDGIMALSRLKSRYADKNKREIISFFWFICTHARPPAHTQFNPIYLGVGAIWPPLVKIVPEQKIGPGLLGLLILFSCGCF